MVLLWADFQFAQVAKVQWSQCVFFEKDVITIQLLQFGIVSNMDPTARLTFC